jgi:hypothetical protein
MIFFDSSGNKLASTTLYFDPILPGKQQAKRATVASRCEQIATGTVVEAYDDYWRSDSRLGLRIEGIYGSTVKFSTAPKL